MLKVMGSIVQWFTEMGTVRVPPGSFSAMEAVYLVVDAALVPKAILAVARSLSCMVTVAVFPPSEATLHLMSSVEMLTVKVSGLSKSPSVGMGMLMVSLLLPAATVWVDDRKLPTSCGTALPGPGSA